MCLDCALSLADQQQEAHREGLGSLMKNCLLCDKDVSRIYMLRDPFKAEERALAK